jgi:hypothetical protein
MEAGWGKPTSRTMKKIKSRPFKMTKIQNSHHVAFAGNNNVKHRRGWSSKNLSSSQIPLSLGTYWLVTQIIIRSIIGNPVFPIMIRKLISRRGHIAVWKEIILSGVRVKPKSVNAEFAVKTPHHTLPWPSFVTIEP